MNRIDRLTAILLQLRTKRIVRGQEIADRFGISLRTVYRDIRALEEAGVPIGSEPGMGYFLSPGYHLPPIMFTAEEAHALIMGGKLIEKFSDLAVNRHYECALDKIKAVMGDPEKDHLNTLSSHIEVLKTLPRPREGFPNDFLLDIQSVLGRNRVIRIEYTSGYKNETTMREIEPLGLCFYGGSWHLLAFCRLRRDYRDFRLDRIRSVHITRLSFKTSSHESLPDLISRMVYESDVMPACVRFDKKIIPFVGDQKYFYGFVEEKTLDQQIEMHFLTASHDQFAHWLLGFVDTVEVVSPEPLKKIMTEHAKRLYKHYHPLSKDVAD